MMTHEYTNSEILVGDPLFEQVMRLRGDVLDKTVNAKAQAYPTDGDKNPANRHFVTTCPVSYTHLDVYKRQIQYRGNAAKHAERHG